MPSRETETATAVTGEERHSPENADTVEARAETGGSLSIGDRVGDRYRVTGMLGRGGMGAVYLAIDEHLGDTKVALKVVARPNASARDLERLRKEVLLAQRVTHPGVCRIYDLESAGGLWMIKMEYVAGETLAKRISRGPLAIADATRIARDIADALGAAHARGVVHRDLKPHNVMIEADTGRVVLMDFGIARNTEVVSDTTEGAIGTPAYMAPEQVRAQRSDGRTDLYALGCVLYEMLVGEVPFPAKTALAAGLRHIEDAPPDPRAARPAVPPALARLVLSLLAKDRDQRPASAAAVVAALAGRSPTRRRWVAGAGGVALVGIVAVVALVGRPGGGRHESSAPRRAEDRALTSSDPGPVTGALSPDGATLALARDGRVILQDVESGKTRDLVSPGTQPFFATWFPDGDALLVAVVAGSTTADFYVLPIDGGPPRVMPFHGWGASIASDGERVATYDEDGIRVTRLDGSDARLLVGTRDNAEFAIPTWSPDDRWVAYALTGRDLKASIRAVRSDGSADVLLLEDPSITPINGGLPAYTWLSDGRLVYARYERDGTRLMSIDVDRATGRIRGEPTVLASYADTVNIENGAADARRLLYSRTQTATLGYLMQSSEVRADDHPGWELIGRTADGSTSYYLAPSGTDRLDLLALDDRAAPRVLATLDKPVSAATLTPDGASVLYGHGTADGGLEIRRVALGGGESVVVDTLADDPGLYWHLTCSRTCVFGATQGTEQTFSVFDPLKGRGAKIVSLHGPGPWAWDLSASGDRLLVAHRQDSVRIIDVASGEVHHAVADPRMLVFKVAWLGDGPEFVLAGATGNENHVVRWDGKGNSTTLWSSEVETVRRLRALGDGATIYVRTHAVRRNFWLLDQR